MRTTDNLGLKITEGNDDWRDIFDDNADNMDTLDGLADVIAPQYDPEDSYFAGDYCMHQGKTYQALVDVDEEAWTAAHWQEVAIMDEIHNANFRGDQMDEGLAYVAVKSGNNWQLPSGKNAVAGDYIILYGALGRAKSAITGGTTNITSSNWESVSNGALNVQNDAIKSLEGSIAHIVGNTNSTGAALAVGDYVYVTGHSTIPDGLRKVSSVIASGVSITTSNTSAVPGGIGSEVASLNSNLANKQDKITWQDYNPGGAFEKAVYDAIQALSAEENKTVSLTTQNGYHFIAMIQRSDPMRSGLWIDTDGAIKILFSASSGASYQKKIIG